MRARSRLIAIVGFVLGATLSLATATASAQGSNKITGSGWSLCVDFQANNVALTIQLDGAAAVPAAGVVWGGTVAPFEAQIPVSQFPAAAKTIGLHTAVVTAPSASVVMADGSTQVIPGGSITVTYEVISATGPAPSNPRWKKVVGTLALVIGAVAAWMLL